MMKKFFIKITLIFSLVIFTFPAAQIEQSTTQSGVEKGKKTDKAEEHFELAMSNLKERNIDKAIFHCEKAVELEDGNSQYHLWLGTVYGEKAKQSSWFKQISLAGKIKKEYLRAVQLDGNNTDARFSLMRFYMRAPGIMGGSNKKADEQASEILKINPSKGHVAFARIHEYREDFSEAKAECLKALEINSNEMYAYFILGKIALLTEINLAEGTKYFKRYLEVPPDLNSPPWTEAYWRLGMVYEKIGQKEQAVSAYKKALELDPNNKEARKALKKFQD